VITRATSKWNISLSAWIIQDGNYPDFAAGEIVEFAVEYYRLPETAVEPTEADVSAQLAGEMAGEIGYNVVAEKVLETDEITVLNVGILVYREEATQFPDFAEGRRFRTQLAFGIDPYFYFERQSKNERVPPLIYSWRINSILRQTAPFIEVVSDSGAYAGQKMMVRDSTKLGYQEIPKTDAWQDDGGTAEYILCCDLLPIRAKRISATAT
jgi:hypothetical protein